MKLIETPKTANAFEALLSELMPGLPKKLTSINLTLGLGQAPSAIVTWWDGPKPCAGKFVFTAGEWIKE